MKYTAQLKQFIKVGIPAIVFSVFILAAAQIIFAQIRPRSITISPPTIEHTLNPGDRTEGVLKITNNGDADLTFTAAVRDFIVEDKAGTPTILSDNTLSEKYSGASWVAVTPNTFAVGPGETKSLNYYLQVPLDAAPGGRYAAAIYEPINIIAVEGTGAGVNTQLGSLFYITVAGPVTESAEVTRFETSPFSEYPPVAINTEIKNNSDIHVKPSGSIIIRNLFGQEVERQEISVSNIFPEASLIYVNTVFKDSDYKIGRYTAELSAIYGVNNNLPLNATLSFIIFPWKIALAAALIVTIAIITLLLLRRRKDRKEENRAQNPAG